MNLLPHIIAAILLLLALLVFIAGLIDPNPEQEVIEPDDLKDSATVEENYEG